MPRRSHNEFVLISAKLAPIFSYARPDQMAKTLDMLPTYEAAGCQHAILSFYQPPTARRLAAAAPVQPLRKSSCVL